MGSDGEPPELRHLPEPRRCRTSLQLATWLPGNPVALDTSVFFYFMEEHPRFLPLLEPLFRANDPAGPLSS